MDRAGQDRAAQERRGEERRGQKRVRRTRCQRILWDEGVGVREQEVGGGSAEQVKDTEYSQVNPTGVGVIGQEAVVGHERLALGHLVRRQGQQAAAVEYPRGDTPHELRRTGSRHQCLEHPRTAHLP